MQVFTESFIPTKLLTDLSPTLLLAKATEVALQTQHSEPTAEFPFNNFVLYEREVVSPVLSGMPLAPTLAL